MVVCPVCGAAAPAGRLTHVAAGTRYVLHRCAACTVQHWQPLVHPGAEYYSGEAVALYEAVHAGAERGDPRHEHFFARYGSAIGPKVLDAGCGNGAFLAKMKARGHEVWGFDIDARSVEVAQRRGLANVQCSSAEAYLERAAAEGLSFDLVVAFDVVEHVTDPVAFLRLLLSRLRPRGRFFMTVPNRERLFVNAITSDFPPHHFFRFDRSAGGALLTHVGLKAVEAESFQFGYAALTGLNALRRRLRPPRPLQGASAPAAAGKVKVAGAVGALVRPPSALVERALGRGFKLAVSGVRPPG